MTADNDADLPLEQSHFLATLYAPGCSEGDGARRQYPLGRSQPAIAGLGRQRPPGVLRRVRCSTDSEVSR